jgi:hypothetical protein
MTSPSEWRADFASPVMRQFGGGLRRMAGPGALWLPGWGIW